MITKINRSVPIANALLLLLLFVAAISLVACGGDDEPPAEVGQPTATESTVAPTATELPAPTAPAEPTDEPTAEPTAEPTELAPTETPEEPSFATGECGHAYYPVIDGRVLTYTTNSPVDGTSEFSTTFTNVTDSSFTLSTEVGDEQIFSTDWQCSADGLLSPEFSQLPGDMAEMSIEFVEATGVTIPSEDMFQVGESWLTHYVANAQFGEDDSVAMEMVQTIDMVNTVTAIEPISVPAGDFPNAVRIETVATINSTMGLGDNQQPGLAFDMNYISWYAEGVGLIRQEMPDFFAAGSDYITELVAIE